MKLRAELLHITSLLELELDFSEEDVEFADRSELRRIAGNIDELLTRLCRSFSLGNVIKNGVPVAIVGNTNVGKSTLLNALLREDRAIVSDIAGTSSCNKFCFERCQSRMSTPHIILSLNVS